MSVFDPLFAISPLTAHLVSVVVVAVLHLLLLQIPQDEEKSGNPFVILSIIAVACDFPFHSPHV